MTCDTERYLLKYNPYNIITQSFNDTQIEINMKSCTKHRELNYVLTRLLVHYNH